MSTHSTPTGQFHDVPVGHFDGGKHLAGEEDNGLRKILKFERARQRGVIPSARCDASVQPAVNDLAVSIGGTDFKVVAALGAAGAFVQVLRGADAAHTWANIVLAINGDAASLGTSWLEAAAPFAKPVLADLVTATKLRARAATARGGSPVAIASASIPLAAAVTGGAQAWDRTDLNATGKALTDQEVSVVEFPVTPAMVTAQSVTVELPFTIKHVFPLLEPGSFSFAGSTLTVALFDGGGQPTLVAGDVAKALVFG